jgi:hypothetical protein
VRVAGVVDDGGGRWQLGAKTQTVRMYRRQRRHASVEARNDEQALVQSRQLRRRQRGGIDS